MCVMRAEWQGVLGRGERKPPVVADGVFKARDESFASVASTGS